MSQVIFQSRDVEAGKVKNLCDLSCLPLRLLDWAHWFGLSEFAHHRHSVLVVTKLDQTQPIAR
jgi:hypothetical protein